MDAQPPAEPPVDPVAEELIADMMRLGLRQYSEVGVPMFLVAEDLRGTPSPASDATTHWRDVATLFAYRAEVLAAHKPDLGLADVARLVEVFADRYLVANTVPSFSAIPEALARRSRETPSTDAR